MFNDAKFTDKDWEGIQMIQSSNKEHDLHKVGRYGLGFKSVFHVTGKTEGRRIFQLITLSSQCNTEL